MLFFSMANAHRGGGKGYEEEGEKKMYYNSSSDPVDCTLSLGTPSTRGVSNEPKKKRGGGSAFMGSFGWNVKTAAAGDAGNAARDNRNANGGGGDRLLDRRCTNCDTTSTPLWRNGPRGPKSLCNACGIRFKKEERRATAAAAAGNVGVPQVDGDQQRHYAMNAGVWGYHQHHHHHHPHGYGYDKTLPSYSYSPAYVDDGVSFLSWRLNVTATDRPGLMYDLN